MCWDFDLYFLGGGGGTYSSGSMDIKQKGQYIVLLCKMDTFNYIKAYVFIYEIYVLWTKKHFITNLEMEICDFWHKNHSLCINKGNFYDIFLLTICCENNDVNVNNLLCCTPSQQPSLPRVEFNSYLLYLSCPFNFIYYDLVLLLFWLVLILMSF